MKNNTFKQTEIGEIPQEWNLFAVEEFAEVIGGGTPSTKDSSYFGGDIPWITPKDLSTWTNKRISRGERNITEKGLNTSGLKLLPKNSVLLTSRAPVGYLAIADNAVATNQGFKSLIPKENADSDFVYYLLKSNVDKLKNNASGSTFQELSGGVLKKIKFALPGLPEQQQIASILSSLDDKIELNRRMNKTLEEIGKALFKRWFVDFEFPFDFALGKPDENGQPYKSNGGEMVESELGEIPRGWRVSKVKEVAILKSGFAFKGSTFKESGKYGVIKIKNIIDPDVDLTDIQYVSEEDVNDRASQYILNSGDILIAMSGNTTGKIGILVKGDGELVLNQRVGKYFIQNKNFHWYLYFLLRSGDVQKAIVEKAYGSAQPNISPSLLEDILMFIPDSNTLAKYVEISSNLMERYIFNHKEVLKFTKLRDSLLPRLMSGRLRV